MVKTNIIQRRDLEPLWRKAKEIASYYETALDCVAAVMETHCTAEDFSKHPKALIFCSLCVQHHQHEMKKPGDDYPCYRLHRNAAVKACETGGSYSYTCPAGFLFWTSPFFVRQRFAGALFSSVVPETARQKSLDRLYAICKGDISRSEIARHIDDVPAKADDDIQALVRMLFLCAECISLYGSRPPEEALENVTCFNHNCQHESADLLERERLLIASLRRGDSAEAQKITKEILNGLGASSPDAFEQVKLKAIELVVLLSRTGADTLDNRDSLDSSSQFIARIMDSKTSKELTGNMCLAVERMAGKIFSFRGIRHASALRKAERFIWGNYTRKISLKEVADESGLSVPYFSTIFKDEMGENFSSYLNRLRIEKAAAMLLETEYPINNISAVCGFEDQSWFSKIFRMYTGMNPWKYRELGGEGSLLIQNGWKGKVILN